MFLGVFSADWIFSLHCCFFRCFYSTTNFTIAFPIVFISRTFITITVFVRNPAFVLFYRECYGFKRVFFTLTRFLSYTPSWHLAQPSHTFFILHSFLTFGTTFYFIKASLGPAVPPWRWLQDVPLRFKTDLAHLFVESHSVQQNVIVSRFYLCVKALRNTISASSMFCTLYLITMCIAKPISYPLSHRSC